MSDRASWTTRHQERDESPPPSPFVVDALSRLGPPHGDARAIDVACGRGRHALLLARTGYAVLGVDWAVPALRSLRKKACHERLPVACLATDVSTWSPPEDRYTVVLSTNYLDRRCFERLRRAVAPGGVLLLETFLDGQQHYGHPTNPDYLLRPGELAQICRGWDVLHAHEGLVTRATNTAAGTSTTRATSQSMMAGVLARRP